MTQRPSDLFFAVRNRRLARQMGQAQAGAFDPKLTERAGTVLTTNSINVAGQRYDLINGVQAPAGAALDVVNVQRPAAAIFAPKNTSALIRLGGSSGGTATTPTLSPPGLNNGVWLGRSDGLKLGLWPDIDGSPVMGLVDAAGVPVVALGFTPDQPGSLYVTIGYGDKAHLRLTLPDPNELREVHRDLEYILIDEDDGLPYKLTLHAGTLGVEAI